MSESLCKIEKELRKKKIEYLRKIEDLFKPYAEMTEKEKQRLINDPHYSSRTAEAYYKEIAEIEKELEKIWWLTK